MLAETHALFKKYCPKGIEFSAIRIVTSEEQSISVLRGNTLPISRQFDCGLMITLFDQGCFAYAATSDVSETGVQQAIIKAQDWLVHCQNNSVNYQHFSPSHHSGEYSSPVTQPWESTSTTEKIEQLRRIEQALKQSSSSATIVDSYAALHRKKTETLYATNEGGEIYQHIEQIYPSLFSTANKGSITQRRSLGPNDYSRQGGLEILEGIGFHEHAARLNKEALQLVDAPNCPTTTADLILMPNQMMLQIHESIGHPLELDRILGDERNYAGTSFVDLDMFGHYQYGSSLLNVSFDPTHANQIASYGFDDDGKKAEKVMVIENGILQQPLGGHYSVARVGENYNFTGTANARATNWNRPALDRMANLNVEPGSSTLADIIKNTEDGILMDTNCSWSIDDSRNKFQFGCELGRIVKNGELQHVVRNPNYRGISANFWRNLAEVGDRSTFDILGTPYCGKAEPNQVIPVGHASPVCRFNHIDMFGGE